MIRKSLVTIEEVEKILRPTVLTYLNIGKKSKISRKSEETPTPVTVKIKGEEIYALSDRYKLFFTKGYKCVDCGIEGEYFALERNEKVKRYHLNFYATDENGEEIMMTKDHIFPKSKGGKDILSNYQAMCLKCNSKKGHSYR